MSLPPDFIARVAARFPDIIEEVVASFDRAASASILLNPHKGLSAPHVKNDVVPWNPEGRYLDERPAYIADPHYHAGMYYSQDASSMSIGHALRQLLDVSDPLILDLCAAPGGKSLDILNVLDGDGLLLSNEIIRSRNGILRENISKWGHTNTIVCQSEAVGLARYGALFDAVLIDAPCSGEGLFRKDAKARNEWSLEAVDFCAARQRKIIADIAPAIKQGGLLIYSTCTFASQENEGQFAFIKELGFEGVDIPIEEEWGIEVVEEDGAEGYAFLPHRVRGEGLFMVAFRKTVDAESDIPRRLRSVLSSYNGPEIDFLSTDHRSGLVQIAEEVSYLPVAQHQRADLLSSLARLSQVGCPVTTLVKGRSRPRHESALSHIIDPSTPGVTLDREQALRYLRGETFVLDTAVNGFALATYEGSTLGWIKMAAGRMKNHYPKGWRIRKEMRDLLDR